MSLAALGPIAAIVDTVVKRVWPDPEKQAQAQLELAKLAQEGQFKEVTVQLQAILAEAQSSDPWTSRARPSFLYVIYVMILAGIPMGFLSAFQPEVALAVATGMKQWLTAIPDELYTLFGFGYLGYTGMRGVEKWKGGIK